MTVQAPPVTLKFNVRCSHRLKNGEVCNKLLAVLDDSRKEIDLASQAELQCERCGEKYRLADYL